MEPLHATRVPMFAHPVPVQTTNEPINIVPCTSNETDLLKHKLPLRKRK
ncbi:hypothetical protein ACFOET_19305 [Parapedobacter deserti]|uniref:Uncharacterized protein n=1 Tax=Parapedobacter deserti TaxID=1912957 RepID=A0ABV7JNW6_9SPHI